MATRLSKPQGVELPPTLLETLVSFLYACVFGIAALIPWMKLKDVIAVLITALTGNQYVYRAAYIFSTLALGVVWVVFFFLGWHRMEHNFNYKRGLLKMIKWSAIALGIYLLALGGQALMDTYLLGI